MRSIPFQIPLSRPLLLSEGLLENKSGHFLISEDSYAEISPLHTDSESLERANEWGFYCLQNSPKDVEIRCNGWIGRLELPETDQLAASLKEQGYKTVKMKIGSSGSLNVSLEKQRIENVKSYGHVLRLDANRSLSLQQAELIFDDLDIDYAEEPLTPATTSEKHLGNLEELSMRTGIWYALDETLETLDPVLLTKSFPRLDGLKALVIKPQVLGMKTFSWIEWANANQKQVIISSLFETAVGLHQLACLAESLPGIHGPSIHGIDASHLLKPPLVRLGDSWIFNTNMIRSWLEKFSLNV